MTGKQRIWVASEFYYPEFSSATGYFLTGISEKLTEKYDVNVITASQNYSGKKNEEHNDVDIIRLKGASINKNSLILRTLKFLYLAIQYLFILLFKCKKGDKLCVVTNPAPIVIIGALISKIKDMEYIIIVHDIFPENLVGANVLTHKSILYKILLPVFNWSYSKSNRLIAMGEDMNEFLKNKLPKFEGEISIIPNWSDVADIKVHRKEENEVLNRLNLISSTVFTFAGNIGRAQGIPSLIESINSLPKINGHFLFFGNGALLKDVEDASLKPNSLIAYGGVFPRSQKEIFLSAADIAIITLANGMAGLGVPSKTYDFLAAGKPLLVIAERNSEIANLVHKYKIGWVCQPDKKEEFTKTIIEICECSSLKEMGKRAKDVAIEVFAKEKIVSKYKSII